MSAHTLHGTTRIFVYGTLRQGQRNHHILSEAVFVGTGATVARYTLRVDGGLPYLDARDARYSVRGEVYEVSTRGLAVVDHLEGHPKWYRRRAIDIRLDAESRDRRGAVVEAFAYFHANPPGVIHPTGDFLVPLTPRRATEVHA